ncbi:hypothetical protein ACVITL_006950 [Rhizobium pisi]
MYLNLRLFLEKSILIIYNKGQWRPFGYRRVHVLPRRDGWPVNPKRIYRLYNEMDLQLRNKVPKRRVDIISALWMPTKTC